MGKTRPIYKKALIAAIAIYIACTALMLADIYMRVGAIEHALVCRGHGHK